MFRISNFKSEDRSIIFLTFKARVPGGFRYLSEPQELLVIDFQDPAQVKDAIKDTKFLSRQFKVNNSTGDQYSTITCVRTHGKSMVFAPLELNLSNFKPDDLWRSHMASIR